MNDLAVKEVEVAQTLDVEVVVGAGDVVAVGAVGVAMYSGKRRLRNQLMN